MNNTFQTNCDSFYAFFLASSQETATLQNNNMTTPPSSPSVTPEASSDELREFFNGCTGFACANFSVAGEISPSGELFKRILFNPPILGRWLEPWGQGKLTFEYGGKRWVPLQSHGQSIRRVWPFVEMDLSDPARSLDLKATAWAPVVAGDEAATALPVLAADLQFKVDGPAPLTIELAITPRTPLQGSPHVFKNGNQQLGHSTTFGIGWQGLTDADEVTFVVGAGGQVLSRATFHSAGDRAVSLYLLIWDPACRSAADVSSLPDLFRYICLKRSELRAATLKFPQHLPATGDAEIDEFMRWYLVPATILTRILKDGTTLTMGYSELNQRDSFWSSWLHLYYWPRAEQTMIEEAARAVGANGKIPICILPTIDRQDEVDANEYFLLRVARFATVHGELQWLRQLWPQCQAAMEYLVSRCGPDSHLPAATSFWADWLDVPFMQQRVYGPHFCLLYLACLKEISALARRLGDEVSARRWEALYPCAFAQANRPTSEGGLWNGRYYVNVWQDARVDATLFEDQMIAGIWGVIPPERLNSIRQALTASNEQPWGVRCLFPYYENMGYSPGDYANGAVMPWINFADACARGRSGHQEDCLRLLRHVGHWDLAHFGDYLPHENLHGETGENTHAMIQGWNAAYLGAVIWGLGAPPRR